MNRDHTGEVYSITVDDEERFDWLVKQIKAALRLGQIDQATDLNTLLDQEFSHCRFKKRSC